MTLKTLVVDGISVEMTDTAVQVVQRALDAANGNIAALKKAQEEEAKKTKDALDAANGQVAKLTTEVAAKDAENVTLKKAVEDGKLTPEKLDALVKDRAIVGEKAKVLLPTVVVDGKSVDDIMKQVVDSKLGEAAKAWDAAQIKVSFDTMTASANLSMDGVNRTRDAFSFAPAPAAAQAMDAKYDARDKRLNDAWKGPAANA